MKLPSLSLTSTRPFAPTDFRRWVLGGVSSAAIGYTTITMVGLWRNGYDVEYVPRLLIACVVCYGALLLAFRGREMEGALLALTVTWLELEVGFLYSSAFPGPGLMIPPVLVLGVGMLLGSRPALRMTLVTLVTTVLTWRFSPALRGTGFTSESVYWLTLFGVGLTTAWLLTRLSLSAFLRVFREMEQKERDLADTIRFAPDGVLVVDGAQTVRIANPAAAAVLDVPTTRIVGHSLPDLLAEVTRHNAKQEPLPLLLPLQLPLPPAETNASPIALTWTNRHGVAVHVEAMWRRMEGDRHQLLLHDVSARVLAETQQRQLAAQLAQAQRLEAVGHLAGSLSHDFNNILTAMGGSAELLRHERDPLERVELIDEIIAARDRGAALTRQLLAFARNDAVQPRVVDLAELVQRIQSVLHDVAGNSLRLSLQLTPGCRVRSDVDQLEQAVVNLVSNARDAMGDGGRCTISVTPEREDTGKSWVRLRVTDEGRGMAEDVMSRAFEPFFTTKPRGQGTGLGLASVMGTAMRSGGAATIDSVPGIGTCVTISLPAADALPEVDRISPIPPLKTSGPYSVLLAEDDDATRSIVERMLRRAGYAVHSASDGAEAVRILESGSVRVDLVLTDVMMPGLSGRVVAARAQAMHPRLPVLFMSGYADASIGDLDTEHADRALVTKPFSSTTLLSRISEMLQSSHALSTRYQREATA